MTANQPSTDRQADAPDGGAIKAAMKASESIRDKVAAALIGFILTGVIGTIVTTWVQQRGWSWQNRVTKIEKDTDNAMAAYRSASELINGRWHATYRMARTLERQVSGDDFKAVKDAFEAADRDWALRYTNVARDVEFNVDTPFAVDGEDELKKVWALSCNDYAFRPATGTATPAAAPIAPTSARVVLAVINHCHGRLKDELEDLADRREKLPAAERRAATDRAFRQLDHLYRTNDVLRCLIFERALAIRSTASAESYWSTFFGVGPVNYTLPDRKRGCDG